MNSDPCSRNCDTDRIRLRVPAPPHRLCMHVRRLTFADSSDCPEALGEPLLAFPSWFLRIECDRCGKVQMVNEAHVRVAGPQLRDILARMRHDGCGGRAGKAELLTGIEGVVSRPVRRIVLQAELRPLGA